MKSINSRRDRAYQRRLVLPGCCLQLPSSLFVFPLLFSNASVSLLDQSICFLLTIFPSAEMASIALYLSKSPESGNRKDERWDRATDSCETGNQCENPDDDRCLDRCVDLLRFVWSFFTTSNANLLL